MGCAGECESLRTADLYGQNLTLEAVPATDDDAAIIAAAGGIERTPAFALRLRFELQRDGQPLATTPAARPGDPAQLDVTIHAPDGQRAHAFDLTHGARYNLAIGLGRTRTRHEGDPLRVVGQQYFHRLRQSAQRIFDLYDIATAQDVHVGLVGHELEVVRVAGLPARIERRFIVLDMPGLTMAPYARGPDRTREPEALTLLGHQSSYLEGAVPQNFYGGEGWSAQRILAETRRRQQPLHRLDLTQNELIRELEPLVAIPREAWEEVATQVIGATGLTLPAELARQLKMQLSLRRTAIVPHAPLPSGLHPDLPSLAGFASYDPQTGEGAYLIHPSLNGGFLVTADFQKPLGPSAISHSDIVHLPRCGTRNDWRHGAQHGVLSITLRRVLAGYCHKDRNDLDPEGQPIGTCRHPVYVDEPDPNDPRCPGPLAGTAEAVGLPEDQICPAIQRLTALHTGALCTPPADHNQEIDREQCGPTSLRSRFNVVVFLNGRLAWKHLFDLDEINAAGEGLAPWLGALPVQLRHHDGDQTNKIIRYDTGMGYATNFQTDIDATWFRFDYRFDDDPRLPALGNFDVYVYPQLDDADAMCRVGRHATGNYTLLRNFHTFAPPAQLDYAGIGTDDGRFTHAAPQEFGVPTPGGPLTFQRFYNASAPDILSPLGPGWTHNHQSKILPTTSGDVVLLRPNGQAVLWHQRYNRPNEERGGVYTFQATGGDRGRLRRYSVHQPPRPGEPRCAPRQTGYIYTEPNGTRHFYELARDRATQRRPDTPGQPTELLRTRIRDLNDNGFDYIYDPETYRLTQVLAITHGEPAHHLLQLEYERLPVTTAIPDLEDLHLDRLTSVSLGYSEAPLTRPPPQGDCQWPLTPAQAQQVLTRLDMSYDAGLPLHTVALTRFTEDRPIESTWTYGYGDFGPPVATLSTLRDPEGRETTIEYEGRPSYDLDSPPPSQGIDERCGEDRLHGEDGPAWCSYRRIDCLANREGALDWTGASYLPQAHVSRIIHPDERELTVAYDRARRVVDDEEVDICATTVADTRRERPVEFETDPRGSTIRREDEHLRWGVLFDRIEELTIHDATIVNLQQEGDQDATTQGGLPGDLPLHGEALQATTRTIRERFGDEPGPDERNPPPFFERLSHTEAQGVEQTRHRYDEQGRLQRTEAPEGAFLEYTNRDEAGRPQTLRRPTSERHLIYDARFGLPQSDTLVEDGQQLESTTTRYDPLGRLTHRTTPGGAQIQRLYEASNYGGLRISETITPRTGDPYTRTQEYNRTGQLRRHTSGQKDHEALYQLDFAGRVQQIQEGPLTTRLHYDQRGRLADRHQTNDDHHQRYTYDPEARLSTVSVQEGEGPQTQIRHQTYDALDRIQTLTERGAHTWQRAYDVTGNLAQVKAEDDETTTERWHYDPRGRLRQHAPPGQGTWTYDYDDANRLQTKQRPDGIQTDYGYDDPTPNPTSINSPQRGLQESLTWDAKGQLKSRERTLQAGPEILRQHTTWNRPTPWQTVKTDNDNDQLRTTTSETDGIGQLVRQAQGGLVQSFSYDPTGNLTRFGQPGLTQAQATYDALGRPKKLIDPAGIETQWNYNGGTKQTDVLHPDGTISREKRDPLGRPTLRCEPGRPSRRGAPG